MNHPYLFPDECPWTQDYQELMEERKAHLSRWVEDDGDLMGCESIDVI